jgi:hypothetical protein
VSTSIATAKLPKSRKPKETELPPQRHADAMEVDQQAPTPLQLMLGSIEEQIRDRAYQLYMQRGYRDGHAVQDWLDAEFELHANR